MNRKQALNPYLPSYEYIPDGEVHKFGDRVYLYGSHDRFDGRNFCLNDYVCYSADIHDLTEWRYEGVIYRKEQDPRNQNIREDEPEAELMFGITAEREDQLNHKGTHAMYAPDVVQGIDGRYYLYYCLDCLPEIGVAVSDSPTGAYEFLGFVRHKDNVALGNSEGDLIQFDPGVFVDDDGTVYLYSGNAPIRKEFDTGKQGSQVMTLEKDMLTLKEEPRRLLPDLTCSQGTGYEGHEFFEASSIRKIHGNYYLVYSSVNSHELCYAVSDRPDTGYRYGGTVVDIGDVYLEGRTQEEAVNSLGNTHGCLEEINGQWYVFYHRQTNRTNFSRQACAEKVFFDAAGKLAQAEVTSCGLNREYLKSAGRYPARICCHLTAKQGTTFAHPLGMKMDYPYLTQEIRDVEPTEELFVKDSIEPVQFVKNIQDGTTAGFKYFEIKDVKAVCVEIRGKAKGRIVVSGKPGGDPFGKIKIEIDSDKWVEFSGAVQIPEGKTSLYFTYEGTGCLDFRSFEFVERQIIRQYEMAELRFLQNPAASDCAGQEIRAEFEKDGTVISVKGFYAGEGTYIVRFYPKSQGIYRYKIWGAVEESGELSCERNCEMNCEAAELNRHGMVRAKGVHFQYEDGTWYYPFGTTVYALVHQEEAVIEQTMDTLKTAPFNKIRVCVFPKSAEYNQNDPEYYAFEKTDGRWDVRKPCRIFWDRLEQRIRELDELGIQCDLILFHPYDRWGFWRFTREEALIYLDYAVRRLAAFPNIWWSLGNEYDLLPYEQEDWECFAHFMHQNDPYGHLLSNHNMVHHWDFSNPDTTHICLQIKNVDHVSQQIARFKKPLMVDECCYEGNVPMEWGNLSAFEMVNRFWKVCMQGGYCTHGETYENPEEILWWSKGGRLIGESPARIGFLREIIESLPGPLSFAGKDTTQELFEAQKKFMPEEVRRQPYPRAMSNATWEEAWDLLDAGREFKGTYQDEVILKYCGRHRTCREKLELPEGRTYEITVIDAWNMTAEKVMDQAQGTIEVKLPGRKGMAILAKIKNQY